MKVLFIGNSHTYFNDMPELFARFAEISVGEKPEVTMLAYSGRDLEWHRREYFSVRFNLMYGGYDFCVIQQAAHPYPPEEKTMEYGRQIIGLCQKCGVTPVIFMTWAEERFPENQQKMIDTCAKLAHETNALIAPVGAVWQKVQRECPDIRLYFRDGEHAGPYGDFLIAAVLCLTLTGSISDEVSGNGRDFLRDSSLDFSLPVLIERAEDTVIPLDKDKTDRILKAAKTYAEAL